MGVLEASWTVEIDAPRERCYEIAADVANAPKWQGTLEEVEVIERDAEGRAELSQDRTRATYGLRGDPGRVLSLLLRGPVEAKVKEFLTRSAAEGLKSEAEAGT